MSDALYDGIAAVQTEAGGALIVHVIRPTDSAALVAAATMRDITTLWLSRAVFVALDHIDRTPKRLPTLCGGCSRQVGKAFAICVAVADYDNSTSAITFTVCRVCSTDVVTIHEKALIKLHRIWPSTRPILMGRWHEGGRA